MEPSAGKRLRGADLPLLPVIGLVSLLALVLGLLALDSGASNPQPARPATRTTITITRTTIGRPVPAGFLGLSLEYPAVEAYAGTNPSALNPVFTQLIRNLTPGQSPVLRIGGDSSDTSWWAVPKITRPPGVSYTLTPARLQVIRALEQALGAHVILGLNLEADSPFLAAAEATALTQASAPGAITAFELGNEPELYFSFPWYRTSSGRAVYARPRTYGVAAYLRDFKQFPAALPRVALAGPTSGGEGFLPYLGRFLTQEPGVRLVTVHRYPLQLCFASHGSPSSPTIENLLASQSSTGLADSFAASVALAHGRGLPLRIDELNTVSCGADAAISQSFASALWSLDTLFAMARVGVDGVNIHTFPGAGYQLFTFTHTGDKWTGTISPEYYGLLMFARAAPPGSRLLSVSGAPGSQLRVWATRLPGGRIHVLMINEGAGARVVTVRVPGAAGPGRIERLEAPSLTARDGVSLGGRSFGADTVTGTLSGAVRTTSVTPARGSYAVRLPPNSAALLGLPAIPSHSG